MWDRSETHAKSVLETWREETSWKTEIHWGDDINDKMVTGCGPDSLAWNGEEGVCDIGRIRGACEWNILCSCAIVRLFLKEDCCLSSQRPLIWKICVVLWCMSEVEKRHHKLQHFPSVQNKFLIVSFTLRNRRRT